MALIEDLDARLGAVEDFLEGDEVASDEDRE